MEPHEIGVVFVNFHCAASVVRRARIVAEAGFPAVVVDNSGEYQGPGIIVHSGRNLGFGAACNEGVRHLPRASRFVCFHNPDVDAHPADILRLADRLASTRRPGAVAPVLRTPDGVVRAGYHAPQLIREIGIVARRQLQERPSRVIRSPEAPSRRPPATPGLRFGSGAFLVVSRDAFENVAGFDERFPLYAEDLDLWKRLHDAGFDMVFVDDVVVDHDKLTGSPASSAVRARLRDTGVELYVQLHRGPSWRLYRILHRISARVGRAAQRGPIESLIDAAWARAEAPVAVADRVASAFSDGVMEPSSSSHIPTARLAAGVGALIVTRDPELAHLRVLAERIVRSGIDVRIVDNGSAAQEAVLRAARLAGAVAVGYGENAGVSERLNESLRVNADKEWLLYLDQDSHVETEQIEQMLAETATAAAQVAAISPQYRQMSTGHLGYSSRHLRRTVRTPIGSGTFYRVQACTDVGGFDVGLPLDLGDLEMALRLQREGYSVEVVESVVVDHRVGDRRASTGMRAAAGERHAPWRYYLKWRALVVVARRHAATSPGWVGRHVVGRTIETLRSSVVMREPAVLTESVRGLLGWRSSRVSPELLRRIR